MNSIKTFKKSKGFDVGMHSSGYLFLVNDESPMDFMLNELSRVTKIEKVEKDEIRDSLNLRYETDSEQSRLMNLQGYDKSQT